MSWPEEYSNQFGDPALLNRGTQNPMVGLLLLEPPPVRSVLYIQGVIRIESSSPLPGWWQRFWYRALLGWRWEAR